MVKYGKLFLYDGKIYNVCTNQNPLPENKIQCIKGNSLVVLEKSKGCLVDTYWLLVEKVSSGYITLQEGIKIPLDRSKIQSIKVKIAKRKSKQGNKGFHVIAYRYKDTWRLYATEE